MPYFVLLLIAVLCAVHVARSGRSWLWYLPICFLPVAGPVIYVAYVLLSADARPRRRFADNVASRADPGRDFRTKLRAARKTGAFSAQRALAEDCLARGRFQDAADLYSAMLKATAGEPDAALLCAAARALLLAGDGAGAAAAYERLRARDPSAVDAVVELDYARALALAGRNGEAVRQYESIVPRYPGEEACCRFALFLADTGQGARAAHLFAAVLERVRNAPLAYRASQREWERIAKEQLARRSIL